MSCAPRTNSARSCRSQPSNWASTPWMDASEPGSKVQRGSKSCEASGKPKATGRSTSLKLRFSALSVGRPGATFRLPSGITRTLRALTIQASASPNAQTRQLGDPGDRVKDASNTGRCSGAKPDIPSHMMGCSVVDLPAWVQAVTTTSFQTRARIAARFAGYMLLPVEFFSIPNLGDATLPGAPGLDGFRQHF